jgi:hypothetical protein
MAAIPAATPLTIPVLLTEAVVAGALLHTPPGVPSVKAVVAPVHTLIIPPIADGEAITVTVLVTIHPMPSE